MPRKPKQKPKKLNKNEHAVWLSRPGEYVIYQRKQLIYLRKEYDYVIYDYVYGFLNIDTGEVINLQRADLVTEVNQLDFHKSNPQLTAYLIARIIYLESKINEIEADIDKIRFPNRS